LTRQEQGQFDDYFVGGGFSAISFIVTAREQIEAAAGGEGSGTVGVEMPRARRSRPASRFCDIH
jgi:hypothetical protein